MRHPHSPPEPCQVPHTPCWCLTRPNNPHCKDALPIDGNWFFVGVFVWLISKKVFIKINNKLINKNNE